LKLVMFSPDDTIVALATPPGRGGLAVVRLSGPAAREMAAGLIEGGAALEPRHATLVRVGASPGHRPLDEAVATLFAAPASYTGEDVVEFSVHGSPAVVEGLVSAALAGGARMARAGEFTMRAFLNGRLDLTRAEAVQDLVNATTVVQARTAFDQVQGALAERIAGIEARLFDLVARLEASGDFPEEGYHFISPGESREQVEGLIASVEALLADSRRGRLIREGVTVAIVGRPNVGKSTLFNRLAGVERAIVTAVPGTTRDLLTEAVMLGGTRMTLVDTAGVRRTDDPVEREGVARADRARESADVVVVLLDASEPLTEEDAALLESTAGVARVVASNKSDLPRSAAFATGLSSSLGGMVGGQVEVSAATGDGVDVLAERILETAGLGQTTEPASISNVRHVALLGRTAECLRRARLLVAGELGQVPEEILLCDLRDAGDALAEVTGKRTTDDLLEAIFAKFCIGK
jgi:tRNA modification GTPase